MGALHRAPRWETGPSRNNLQVAVAARHWQSKDGCDVISVPRVLRVRGPGFYPGPRQTSTHTNKHVPQPLTLTLQVLGGGPQGTRGSPLGTRGVVPRVLRVVTGAPNPNPPLLPDLLGAGFRAGFRLGLGQRLRVSKEEGKGGSEKGAAASREGLGTGVGTSSRAQGTFSTWNGSKRIGPKGIDGRKYIQKAMRTKYLWAANRTPRAHTHPHPPTHTHTPTHPHPHPHRHTHTPTPILTPTPTP